MENLTTEISESIEAEVSKIEFNTSNNSPGYVYQTATATYIFKIQTNISDQVSTLGILLTQISAQVGLNGEWVAYAANAAVYGYASDEAYKGNTVKSHGHYLNAIFLAN